LQRIRISSLEPAEFTPELGQLMADFKHIYCDHFHFPLQSGSDRILKLMNRKYDTARYRDSIELARKHFPNAYIGCDIIPGFPGETDSDFNDTLNFIESLSLTSLHVFPYSKRPNTAALRMPGHLPPAVIKERAKILRDWSHKSSKIFYSHYLGKTAEVLWENDLDKDGRQLGKTTNYLNIACPSSISVSPGSVSQVQIKGFLGDEKLLAVPLLVH
jgi:threonylcarbamoyladenosine tRNA methylthiotransferase MtaB